LRLSFYRRGGDVAVFRIVGHQDREFLVILDQSFRKVELDLFSQMRDFLRSQFPAALQIACYFRPDLFRPLRNVEVWCFRQAQERITQRSRQQNTGIENRDDVAGPSGHQSELVINAVFDSVLCHLFNRLMAAAITLFSERNQVLKIDAPVCAGPVERNFSLIEEPYKELPRYPQETRSLLRRHLLGRRGQGYRFSIREIVQDLYQYPVEPVRKRDLMESVARRRTVIPHAAKQFGYFRFLGVRNSYGIQY